MSKGNKRIDVETILDNTPDVSINDIYDMTGGEISKSYISQIKSNYKQW